jgi:hypothetical protein
MTNPAATRSSIALHTSRIAAYVRDNGPIVTTHSMSAVGRVARAVGCTRIRADYCLWQLADAGQVVLTRADSPRRPIIRIDPTGDAP